MTCKSSQKTDKYLLDSVIKCFLSYTMDDLEK